MADNIARLGFAIDTATLLGAAGAARALTGELNKVADAAEKSAKAEKDLNQAAQTGAGAAVTKATATGQLGRVLGTVATSAQAAGASLQTLSGTLTAATAAISGGGAGGLVGAVTAATSAMSTLGATAGGVVGATTTATTAMSSLGATAGGVVGAIGGVATGVLGLVGGYAALAAATYRAQEQAALLEARLKNVYGSSMAAAEGLAAIRKLAQENGIAVQAAGDSFLRLARNNEAIGLTRKEMSDLTETVIKLGRVSGATTGELQSGMLQFSQALAAGRLNGDELRSIMENMPALAKAIADGLGVSVGQLRAMGAEGTLTGDKVTASLLKALPKVREEVKNLPETAEQAFARVGNATDRLLAAIGERIRSSQFIAGLANALAGAVNAAATLVEKQTPAQQRATAATAARMLDAKADSVGRIGRFFGQDEFYRRAAQQWRDENALQGEDDRRASQVDYQRQLATSVRAPFVRSQPIVQELDDLATKTKKLREETATLQDAYEKFTARPDLFPKEEAERLAKYPGYIAALRQQLDDALPVLTDFYKRTGEDRGDIFKFGAGGAASIGSESRDLQRRAAGSGQNISDADALAAVLDRRLTQAEKQAAATTLEVEAERMLATALGRGTVARIEAEAAQKAFNLQMQLFGRDLTPQAAAVIEGYRQKLVELAKVQKDSADKQRLLNAELDLGAARAIAAAVAAGQNAGQIRERQILLERDRKRALEFGTETPTPGAGLPQSRVRPGVDVGGIEAGIKAIAAAIVERFPGVEVTSGLRHGSGSSQHDHGRAVDFSLSRLTEAQRREVVETVLAMRGVGGIGTYDATGRVLHVDTRQGARAAWGPDRTSGSLDATPEWFQSLVRAWTGGAPTSGEGVTFPRRVPGQTSPVGRAIQAETDTKLTEFQIEELRKQRERLREIDESATTRGAGTAVERRRLEQGFAARRVADEAPPTDQERALATELLRLREQDRKVVAERVLAIREETTSIEAELAIQGKIGFERDVALAQIKEINRLREQGIAIGSKEADQIRDAVRRREEGRRRATDAEEQAKAYENVWTTTANSIGNALDSALRQTIEKRKVDFKQLATSIFTDISSALLKATITTPLTQGIKTLGSVLMSAFGNVFDATGPVQAMALGGVNGGIVARPTIFRMANGGMAEAGEAGAEAVLPLKRGNDGRLGVGAPDGGGGGTQVHIYDQRSGDSAPVETRESRGPDGQRMIEVMIRDGVRSTVASGGADPEMRTAYGLGRPVARR